MRFQHGADGQKLRFGVRRQHPDETHRRHLTPRLSGRPEACPVRRERILSSCARGAPPHAHHGPLQAVVRGTAVTAKRSHPVHLALPHRAPARSSSAKRRALTEAAETDPTASVAARHRCTSRQDGHRVNSRKRMALPKRHGNEGSSRSSEVEAPASGFPRTVPLTNRTLSGMRQHVG
jgi:hypothetical protein